MKKVFISVLSAMLVTTFLHAQTSSGNMMVGGSLNFSSVSYEGGNANDGSTVGFSPNFGYFINDNFAIGASLGLGSSRQGTGANKTIRSSFSFGPFARYYMFTSSENFAFFGQAGLTFSTGKTDPSAGGVTKSNAIRFYVSPGAAYFFNEHWALEFSVNGFSISSTDENTSADNDKVTRVDFILSSFSPTLGFRYHF